VLALMADYRRDPRPAAEAAAATGEDATFGSQPALSGTPGGGSPGESVYGRARSGAARAGLARSGGAIRGHGASSGAPRRRRVLLALAAAAAAAAALIVAGVVIGASVAGSRSQSAVPPPPPGGFAPPPPGSAVSTAQSGKPGISMSQATGDSRTGFVVFGGGWAPGSTVTIRLAGVPAPPEHAVTDGVGNFSYAINQDHEFFPGGLPVRAYRIVVTAPGGASASATFTVGRR